MTSNPKTCRLCGEVGDDVSEDEYHLACELEYGELLDEIERGRRLQRERCLDGDDTDPRRIAQEKMIDDYLAMREAV